MSSEKSTRTRKQSTPRKTGRRVTKRKIYREKHIIGFLFGISFLLTLFLVLFLTGLVALKIPDIRSVSHYRPLQTSYVLDQEGGVLERIFVENRTVVPLSKMPALLPKAFVSAEDGRFYDHPGLDFFSVIRAALTNIRRGGKAHGGSTITQQVARSLLLTREKTYLRKFKEAILAWRIDSLLSKDEILYIYLNQIYFGSGAHGVEAAAQTYFNKHIGSLHLGEMAVLAGLPQAPSRYSPFKDMKLARKRQRYVLNRMTVDGYITKQEAKSAYEKPLRLANHKSQKEQLDSGYYSAIAKKRARKILGKSLMQAGVRIHTYLNPDLQRNGVEAIRTGVVDSFGRQIKSSGGKRKVPQGALVSFDGCSAHVVALTGGTDFSTSPFDRAAIAKRPAGSAFKPLIFASALSAGWNKRSLILDAPLTISGGGNRWSPKNYTGKYYGKVTLEEALAHSYNTAAVRLLQKVGLNRVHSLAADLGITSEMPGDLSVALGSVDISLLELTGSYIPFICSGIYAPPVFIEKISGPDGRILYHNSQKKIVVMNQAVAGEMKAMLEKVISRGTGERARGLRGSCGGKTGTSDDNRDAWFIGFSENNMTGVWVGHDKNQTLGKHENGGRTAVPIWYEYMKNTENYR